VPKTEVRGRGPSGRKGVFDLICGARLGEMKGAVDDEWDVRCLWGRFGNRRGSGEAIGSRGGHRVVIVGRDEMKLEDARTRIVRAAGSEDVQTSSVHATDRNAVDRFFEKFGPFDHLVLSITGGKGAGPFGTLKLGDVRKGFEGKFIAQLSVVQSAQSALRPGGSITLISAVSSRAVIPGTLGLGAINAALESTVPHLALELAPTRVNGVAPGLIDTPWWNNVSEERRKAIFEQTA